MTPENEWVDAAEAGLRAQVIRGGAGRGPAVLLLHDAAGIRPSILATARRLAGWGYHVILPDLYAELGEAPLDVEEVFAHGSDWQRMNRMRASLIHRRMDPSIMSLLTWMSSQAWIDRGALASIGLSFGGRFALAAAANFAVPLRFVASIHGGGLATSADDSPHLRAPKMSSHIYVAAAESDPQVSPEELDRLRHALSGAGRSFEIQVFRGTRHGFATPESKAYDAEATERLWQAVRSQLDHALGGGGADVMTL